MDILSEKLWDGQMSPMTFYFLSRFSIIIRICVINEKDWFSSIGNVYLFRHIYIQVSSSCPKAKSRTPSSRSRIHFMNECGLSDISTERWNMFAMFGLFCGWYIRLVMDAQYTRQVRFMTFKCDGNSLNDELNAGGW